MWRTPDLGLICCSRGNLTWCRAAADESGVYLVPQWATDSMLPLLISAGILSFGWGALYRVSRHNCCAPAVRAPYVPPARSRDGVWGRRVDPIKTALLITCNFNAFNQYFSQLFFFLCVPQDRPSPSLWKSFDFMSSWSLFKTNSFQPDDASFQTESRRRQWEGEPQRLIWSHSISHHYHSERRRPLRRGWLRMCYLRNCPFGKCLCCLKSKSSFSSMRSGGIVF